MAMIKGSKSDRYLGNRIPIRTQETLNCVDLDSIEEVGMCLDAYLLEGDELNPDKLLISFQLFKRLMPGVEPSKKIYYRGILCEVVK